MTEAAWPACEAFTLLNALLYSKLLFTVIPYSSLLWTGFPHSNNKNASAHNWENSSGMSRGPGKDYLALLVHAMTNLVFSKRGANNLHQREAVIPERIVTQTQHSLKNLWCAPHLTPHTVGHWKPYAMRRYTVPTCIYIWSCRAFHVDSIISQYFPALEITGHWCVLWGLPCLWIKASGWKWRWFLFFFSFFCLCVGKYVLRTSKLCLLCVLEPLLRFYVSYRACTFERLRHPSPVSSYPWDNFASCKHCNRLATRQGCTLPFSQWQLG